MFNFKESEKVNISPISNSLLNIFTDNYYLELGNIDYRVIERLLNRELVGIDEVSYFDIQNIGIGHASKSTKDLRNILPYIYFENIQNKERSIQLFITCGLLSKIVANKAETFAPIVLIQVKLIFIEGKYYFQSNGIPTENTVLFNGLTKSELSMVNEKAVNSFATIYDIDEFCMQFTRLNNYVVKLENFLTFAITTLPSIVMDHDRFTLSSNFSSYLGNKYFIPGKDEIYNITNLNDKQRLAVQRVNCGDNFAISGIIGTGKTTALINIASDAIRRGKRVLYVSSNPNSIEEVENKYIELQLGNLVANLTDPLLGKSFFQKPKVKKINIVDNNIQLQKAYDVVDEYERNITGRVLDFRFVDVIEELMKLNKPSDDIEIDDLDGIYKHEGMEIIKALTRIEKIRKVMPLPKDSMFSNIPVNNDIQHSDVPISVVTSLHELYSKCLKYKLELEKKYGFNPIPNYAKFKNVLTDIRQLSIDNVPNSWISLNQEKYLEAKDLFLDFKTMVYRVKETKSIIDWEFKNVDTIDVNELIDNILSSYFNAKELDKINSVIFNHKKLIRVSNSSVKMIEELRQFLEYFNNKYEYNGKFDSNWIREVIGFSQFINENYVFNKWCNLNRSLFFKNEITKYEKILTGYEVAKEEYYKVFKSNKDYHEGLAKLNKAIQANKPFKQFSLEDIKKYALDIKNNLINPQNVDKAYIEYESVVGYPFRLGFNASEKFSNFYDFITSVKNENLRRSFTRIMVSPNADDLANEAKKFKEQVNKIDTILANFNIIISYINLPRKYSNQVLDYYDIMLVIMDANNYLVTLSETNEKMRNVVKDNSEFVRFDSYLRLRDLLKDYKKAEDELDSTNDYNSLYGNLYKKGQTTINDIATLISSFQNYTNCFASKEALVNSLERETNDKINAILDEVNSTISEINDAFNSYIKIFKDGIGEYYYGDLEDVIAHWRKILDSKNELDTYLDFTNQIQILFKHKLFKLANLIINGEAKDTVSLFKYRYFKMVYDTHLASNPTIISTKSAENALRQIVNYERVYVKNNVNELKKICKDDNIDFDDLNYDKYINQTEGIKYLYLSDVKTLNRYISIDQFDLVLVDDANLLDADDYDKAISAKQVVVAGEESYRMAVTSSLITRFRSESLMNFDYRYVPTPLEISNRLKNFHSMITSLKTEGSGIEVLNVDDAKYIMGLIEENPDVTINYFTALPGVQRKLFDRLGALLVKNGLTEEKIINILRRQINICDLGLGFFIDADYNIINYDEYGKQFDQDFSAWATNVLICKKKIVVLSNQSDLNIFDELKRSNEKFFSKYINLTPTRINRVNSNCLDKLTAALKRNKYEIVGSYGDLSLILEKKGQYYVILLFVNPESSHFDILSDYRDYYQASVERGIASAIVWLEDLYQDFESAKKNLLAKLAKAQTSF